MSKQCQEELEEARMAGAERTGMQRSEKGSQRERSGKHIRSWFYPKSNEREKNTGM